MAEKHILSKSTFMYGAQCLKRLYLHKNFPELRDELSTQQEAIFSSGTNAGELAQTLFPGGVDCTPESYFDFGPSIRETARLITERHPVIYEAAFQHEGVLAAMDILVFRKDGWHAYEVKSTNSVKEPHLLDTALQYWVITQSGLPLKSMNVMHFNKDYIRQGKLNIQELFTSEDVTSNAINNLKNVEALIKEEKEILSSKSVPKVEISAHCDDPYSCDFKGHCWQHVPEYSVFNLTRGMGRSWDLYDQGILEIADIPADYPLTPNQSLQVQAARGDRTFIDKKALKEFHKGLEYPLYYLDFETIMPSIPLYDQSRPYQMITFQYSLHIQEFPTGKPKHHEFLADAKDEEPRRSFMKKLLSEISGKGHIIVYNQAFEASRLREIARDLPEFSTAIEGILLRMRDLAVPFQKKYYYTASMQGSYSIKKVLPALIPELSYDELEVKDGGSASLAFLQMVQVSFEGNEKERREALLKYCELDTFAMVKIMDKLYSTVY